MKTSKTISKVAMAFLNAQRKIETPEKKSVNPFYKSKYADINAVLTASKRYLNEEGISVLQPTFGEYVQTILLHESGEWMMGKTKIINGKPNDPQAQGIAITYARRYGLQSMLGMGGDDDDGEGAVDRDGEQHQAKSSEAPRGTTAPQDGTPEPATPEQMKYLKTLIMRNFGITNDKELPPLEKELGYKINDISKERASELIGKIKDDMEWVNAVGQRLAGSLD